MIAAKTFSFRSMTNLNAYTKLLVHSNTTDGDGTFTDSSDSGHTLTGAGQVVNDTAQKKFGSTSIDFEESGVGKISIDDSDDFALGSDSFTIDFWARFESTNEDRGFCSQLEDSTSYYSLHWLATNVLNFKVVNGGDSIDFQASWSPSIDTWYHIAMVRNGTSLFLYVNGVSIGSDTSSISIPNISASFFIGVGRTPSIVYFDGWIDEFRLVKGKAMWQSNFVPAAAMYN